MGEKYVQYIFSQPKFDVISWTVWEFISSLLIIKSLINNVQNCIVRLVQSKLLETVS